ncbi:MAG: TetR/AcrR family transcriptional regulator [Betaproteobacteria bacterium]
MEVDASSQPPRGHYHHGDLPQALKKLALELIAAHGVEGFSMRQAAADLGVAPSAMYRHFADKSELLSALAHDGFGALGALWLQRVAQMKPQLADNVALRSLARFSAGADAYFQFGLDHPALFQLMFGPFGTASVIWSMQEAELPTHPYVMLGQALDGLRDAQLITDTARERAEVSAFSAIHGLTCLVVSGVFKDLDAAQKWEQLELVKTNILGGLMAWDHVLQLKAALGAALAPGLLGSALPSTGN